MNFIALCVDLKVGDSCYYADQCENQVCTNKVCQPKLGSGEACGSDVQCLNNRCGWTNEYTKKTSTATKKCCPEGSYTNEDDFCVNMADGELCNPGNHFQCIGNCMDGGFCYSPLLANQVCSSGTQCSDQVCAYIHNYDGESRKFCCPMGSSINFYNNNEYQDWCNNQATDLSAPSYGYCAFNRQCSGFQTGWGGAQRYSGCTGEWSSNHPGQPRCYKIPEPKYCWDYEGCRDTSELCSYCQTDGARGACCRDDNGFRTGFCSYAPKPNLRQDVHTCVIADSGGWSTLRTNDPLLSSPSPPPRPPHLFLPYFMANTSNSLHVSNTSFTTRNCSSISREISSAEPDHCQHFAIHANVSFSTVNSSTLPSGCSRLPDLSYRYNNDRSFAVNCGVEGSTCTCLNATLLLKIYEETANISDATQSANSSVFSSTSVSSWVDI